MFHLLYLSHGNWGFSYQTQSSSVSQFSRGRLGGPSVERLFPRCVANACRVVVSALHIASLCREW